MKPPRRIFRSSLTARTGRVSRTLVYWLGAAIGTVGLLMVGRSSDLFGQAQPGPQMVQSKAGQAAVIDGETLLLGGRVIRLAGVAAPARGEACGAAADCGGTASAVLASLVRNRPVTCQVAGYDAQGRPFGTCAADGADLSQAVVASGWARAAVPALATVEQSARRRGTGLWSAAPR